MSTDASAPKREPVDTQALRTLVNENADWRLVIHRGALPACLDEIEDLRAALTAFKDDYAEDGCYCSSIIGTGKCAICMADAALRGEPKEGM